MKKFIVVLVLVVVFVAVGGLYINKHMPTGLSPLSVKPSPSVSGSPTADLGVDLKDYGPAPEFTRITHWLNSDPLTIASLKGGVVLIDFWTYSCINCIRSLPFVTKLHDTYAQDGLIIVGVHTPEFAFEKDTANVADAIKRFNIHYPVAQDNDYGTWNAYSNQYWPAQYLIDQRGHVVYTSFGEGNEVQTEKAIRSLLGMTGAPQNSESTSEDNLGQVGSPEMYFGTSRLQNLTPKQSASSSPTVYSLDNSSELVLNKFALEGNWQFSKETMKLVSGKGKIKLKFQAGKLHIVASSPIPAKLKITVDGKSQPSVVVKAAELYTLFDSKDYTDHIIEIDIDQPGFEAFTFTFG